MRLSLEYYLNRPKSVLEKVISKSPDALICGDRY
jgi:hypothetical protein